MSCRVIVIFIIAVITAAIAVETKLKDDKPPYEYIKTKVGENEFETIQAGNEAVGVSSIAGITSRNGRVSSVSGVQFYPGIQSPIVATSISTADLSKTTNGKIKYPISTKVVKSEDGKYASSSIKISPGSVSVSSIARSAPSKSGESNSLKTFSSSGLSSLKTPLQPQIKPFVTPPFLQNPFDTRQLNPWFPNYMFGTPYPVRTSGNYQPGYINPLWQYPSLPLINYWQ